MTILGNKVPDGEGLYQKATVAEMLFAAEVSPEDISRDTYLYINNRGELVVCHKSARDTYPSDEVSCISCVHHVRYEKERVRELRRAAGQR